MANNAGRPFFIRVPENIGRLVERRLAYRFGHRYEEQSNKAAQMAEAGASVTPAYAAGKCVWRHKDVTWSGPPHDPIRAWVCNYCHAAACEPEIKDRGYDFDTVSDYVLEEILDLDLKRQYQGARTLAVTR